MWDCKVCQEKDKRIEDLKDQVLNLRTVLNPPQRVATLRYEMESDNLLDGGGKETLKLPIDYEAERKAQAEAQREADMIFSGNVIERN